MSSVKKTRQGSSFGRFCASPPPPTSIMGGNPHMFWAYQSLQAQMFGTHGNVHQPTIWAARGRLGGGKNLPKLERGQLFGPLKGGRWITAGDCSPIVGMPRYRSGSPIDTANHFAWLAPLGSTSKKTVQNWNSGRFFHRRGPRSMPRKEPPSRRSLATERLPEGWGGGGRGAKSSKTRVLAPFWQKAFI